VRLARRALLRTVAVARAAPRLRSTNDVQRLQRASKREHLVAAAPGAHRASRGADTDLFRWSDAPVC
jgi:hypothetical protein